MKAQRALFLDKDGVINVDHGYVATPERTDFIDGIFEMCRAANHQGWIVIVVTNQAGIGRGYYSERDFAQYMNWVRAAFTAHDARIDAVYYCPHHPLHAVGKFRQDCECRKPKPGMLLAAQREWHLDMQHSLMVGDAASDAEACAAARVGTYLAARVVCAGSGQGVVFAGDFRQELSSMLTSHA